MTENGKGLDGTR